MLVTMLVAWCSSALAQVTPVPIKTLDNLLTLRAGSVRSSPISVPMITWGGDMATIMAEHRRIFAAEGVPVALTHEDDFAKQAQGVLDGNPLLRGTFDQVMGAASAFKRAGVELVVLHQYTFSAGGDCLVVRPGIRQPQDLRGKKIALQLWGPHLRFAGSILEDAGVKPSEVTFVWFKELTIPKTDTKGKIIDPVSAFTSDPSIAAVFCISPDAATLTSGGKEGTGVEGSVKGAKILLSTKTAKGLIVDVLAARKDWFSRNRDTAEKVVRALHKGQEAIEDLAKSKGTEYQQVLGKGANTFFGSSTMVADVEGLLADCEFVGLSGNIRFFNEVETTVTFSATALEIGNTLSAMGLISQTVSPEQAKWDYAKLSTGLKDTGGKLAVTKVDIAKATQLIESKIASEAATFSTDGTLFQIEINFEPDQKLFPEATYAEDFAAALKLSQKYSGAVMLIEGHADVQRLLQLKAQNRSPIEIQLVEQRLKNLSLERADAVRASYIEYCKKKGINVGATAVIAAGLGVATPKVPKPRSTEDMAANRRVVFSIKNIEGESAVFKE